MWWNVYVGRMRNSETAFTLGSLMADFRIYIFWRSPASTLNFVKRSGFLCFRSYFVIAVDFYFFWYFLPKTVGEREPGARRQTSFTCPSLDIICHMTQIPDVIIFINLHTTKSLALGCQGCQYLYVTFVISIHSSGLYTQSRLQYFI